MTPAHSSLISLSANCLGLHSTHIHGHLVGQRALSVLSAHLSCPVASVETLLRGPFSHAGQGRAGTEPQAFTRGPHWAPADGWSSLAELPFRCVHRANDINNWCHSHRPCIAHRGGEEEPKQLTKQGATYHPAPSTPTPTLPSPPVSHNPLWAPAEGNGTGPTCPEAQA